MVTTLPFASVEVKVDVLWEVLAGAVVVGGVVVENVESKEAVSSLLPLKLGAHDEMNK